MIKIGPKYVKLKTDLQLACKRLKILQAKKMELSQKLQKEVANHLNKGKFMLAKIKVQTVIRYEAAQEAMEIIELMCEQILDRYGLFEEKRDLDQSLEEAVSSLIWVSPYMRSEVSELKNIFKQLSVKYGSNYSKSALKNKQLTVNTDLIERVKLTIPSEEKIQEFLRYIAKKHAVLEERKIEMEVFLLKSNSCENITKNQNIDIAKSARHSNASNESVAEEVEDSETFEGYGNGLTEVPVSSKKTFSNLKFVKNRKPRVSYTRNFFNDNILPDIPEENEDINIDKSLEDHNHGLIPSVNDDTGDSISSFVTARHHMTGTSNENSLQISDSRNKEVPTETEIRSNILLSTFRKKGNFRLKIPTRYRSNNKSRSLTEEKPESVSKKTESNCSIPCSPIANDFEDNNSIYEDFDQPPSYETVVCKTKEDILDMAHPYQFEVDIKLDFPQYPVLPTCPNLEDLSEQSYEPIAPSHSKENLEKANKNNSDKKKPHV